MNSKKLRFFGMMVALGVARVSLASTALAVDYYINSETTNWRLRAQADVSATGEQLSTVGYNSAAWVNAVVPGTVFGSYVSAGLEPDPNYADNIYHVNKAIYDRNYWYRCEFKVPDSYTAGKIWVNFDGINRDADVYVNGAMVGNCRGYLQRSRFDVTNLVAPGGACSIAVLVYLPVGDTNCKSSPTFIASRGWDWMPKVPGLNMGIWNKVHLSNTGAVSIIDPWIRSDLPSSVQAKLTIQTNLVNNSNSSQSGTLLGTINPGNITFARSVTLSAGQTQTITLDSSSFSQLTVNNPDLWWPNGYGKQNMHTCELAFKIGTATSDFKSVNFGIRQYSYDTDGGVLHVWVNGVKIFLKGGNWGMPEYLQRCKGAEYGLKLHFHQEMNYNMIRNWTGETEDDEFYAACDKYGIMVWDDFPLNVWAINDHRAPTDNDLFNANAIEKIKRFRNHPCIALWCGENEGVPPAPLNDWLKADVATYDGNDRYYQASSNSGNLSGSGPWGDLNPKSYFVSGGAWQPPGLRSELGTAVFTTFDSFKKFIPRQYWWPQNDMWNKHFFGVASAPNAKTTTYLNDVNKRYGIATGIQDFCRKAQLLNFETTQAMYEGWLNQMWNNSSGVLIWMSQSAYPSLVWQTYDYYYDTTGAYWGAKSGCEHVHIFWGRNDDWIKVANTSGQNYSGLTAEAWLFNMDGSQKSHQSAVINSTSDTLTPCFALSFPHDLTATHFIKLRLKNSSGNVVSDNFYWRGATDVNYCSLCNMIGVNLGVSSTSRNVDGVFVINAVITNPSSSGTIALAIRPKVVNAGTGEQVLPVFMSDGYFSLIPGESKNVTIQFDPSEVGGGDPQLVVECWNNTIQRGVNLALNKAVVAKSQENSCYSPQNAVDGDTYTGWASAHTDDEWIYVDLGSTHTINEVILSWEAAYAKVYKIQVSDNAQTWATVYTNGKGHGGVEDLTFPPVTGRYVRMLGQIRGTQYGYSLNEFVVLGAQQGT